MENNIYPIFSKMQSRREKEAFLGQRGLTLWFTGLSGSGKSTVAVALEKALSEKGIFCRIIDGDNVRCGLNAGLGFSPQDRKENIRRVAEVCRLFTQTGIVTLATFISPTRELDRGMREKGCKRPLCQGQTWRDKGIHRHFRSFRGSGSP